MKTWNNFFHNFRINILIRIFLIYGVLIALLFIFLKSSLWTLIFWLALLTLLLIIELIRYLEKFKERFIYFLNAINQNDFTLNFNSNNQSEHDRKLAALLNDVVSKFKNVRSEMEAKQHLLKVIIEQVNVGIITFDRKGEIILVNEAAKKLLNKPYLNSLEAVRKIDESLFNAMDALHSGKKDLVKIVRSGEMLHLSLHATEIKLDDNYLKVITLHDIRHELDEREIDSWQKLVRVINHEIMNSAIPISTLANVLHQMLDEYLEKRDQKLASPGNYELELLELSEGIRTIEDRSKGLTNFVSATKSITNINPPQFTNVNLHKLLERVKILLEPGLNRLNISLCITQAKIDPIILADAEMIEQILINLVKNAQDACNVPSLDNRRIEIRTEMSADHVMIHITDNGTGIKENEMDNIFVPFYTTKPDGSGIGLSLSRQIMKLHNGTLNVKSVYGKGTEFTLTF